MRENVNFNRKWAFAKGINQPPVQLPQLWNWVNLPHTWNGIDGQDGGGDYYRGPGCYVKSFQKMDLPQAQRYYLEINGANSSADVYLNGRHLAHHDGGYSTWRVELTQDLAAENLLAVVVDNAPNLPQAQRYYLEINGANSSADVYLNGRHLAHHDGGYSTWRVELTQDLAAENLLAVVVDNAPNTHVYPQMADFTFYGGLYRDVNLICLPEAHFDVEYFGGPGIKVTPTMDGEDAKVAVEVYVKNRKPEHTVRYSLCDADGQVIGTYEGGANANFRIRNAHLWQGRVDPYLYSCQAELLEDG